MGIIGSKQIIPANLIDPFSTTAFFAHLLVQLQNLGAGTPPTAGAPALSVAGRRLLTFFLRKLLQSSGVQVNLNLNAPAGSSEAVNQALQQAINSGAFQNSLANNGELVMLF